MWLPSTHFIGKIISTLSKLVVQNMASSGICRKSNSQMAAKYIKVF